MSQLFAGAITMGLLVGGLFFLRFWRETHDRLFVFFSLSFFAEAANRLALGLSGDVQGSWGHFYWVRLLAFAIILVAIVDKNRVRPAS